MTSLEQLRREPRVARLESALGSNSAVEVIDPEPRKAAVAILIRLGDGDEPEIFFIQRAIYEGDPWSGQVALPGGRMEPQDASLVDTAIRETFEETAMDLRASAHMIGALDDLSPRTIHLPSIVVRPFVFLMPAVPEPTLSSEVAACFWVPLSVLLDRSVWRDTTVQAAGMEITRFAFHHHGYVVWGMTERILSGLLSLFENEERDPTVAP